MRRHKSAGYGIPAQLLERPQELDGLVGDLAELGGDDIAKGLKETA